MPYFTQVSHVPPVLNIRQRLQLRPPQSQQQTNANTNQSTPPICIRIAPPSGGLLVKSAYNPYAVVPAANEQG
ncbi:hypothetical protein L596_012846 [Steinernema carpocapsae]|uniref:Uncharacterized protein n=1 Tax=Steinernema carpocapsae TaxID=34508 RepID=A0A4U5NYA7_STECR|nr:hypothetical protein L596_012846 [Steinernema carpocapsae]